MRVLITGACAVTGRSVARSLRQSQIFGHDIELIGADIDVNMYGFYEKLYDKIYVLPRGFGDDYVQLINSIIENEKLDAAIVTPEIEVIFWSRTNFNIPCLIPDALFCDIASCKEKLFDLLKETDYVPKSEIVKKEIIKAGYLENLEYPMWIRDASACTASAQGAFKAEDSAQARMWLERSTSDHMQIAEYLPGKNYGCFCLYKNGKLLKQAVAERIDYLMAKVSITGITGNTSKGRLLNNAQVTVLAQKVISYICEKTNTTMNGMVVVDMREDRNGKPKVTEINIRHVAFSSSFANAGFNLAEYHLLATIGKENLLSPEIEMEYPKNNYILRDVDGLPIYVPDAKPFHVGDVVVNK